MHPTCTSAVACPWGCGAGARCGWTRRWSRRSRSSGSRSATTYGGDVAGDIAAVLARESWTVVSGCRVRHRPVGPPRSAGQPRPDGGGAGLRRRPCLPDRAPQPDRLHRRRRAGRLRGRTRLCADPDPLPGPQPADRRDVRGAPWSWRPPSAAEPSTPRAGRPVSGEPVMGVPGPVTSAPSAGVHQLIRARDAMLVTSGEEVLEVVGPMGTYALADLREPEQPATGWRQRERQVLDAVPLVAGGRLRLDRPHGRDRARPHQGSPARPAPAGTGRALARAVAARGRPGFDPEMDAGPVTPSRLPGCAPADVRSLARWICPRSSRARWRRTSATSPPSATWPRTPCAPTSATWPACSSTRPRWGTPTSVRSTCAPCAAGWPSSRRSARRAPRWRAGPPPSGCSRPGPSAPAARDGPGRRRWAPRRRTSRCRRR